MKEKRNKNLKRVMQKQKNSREDIMKYQNQKVERGNNKKKVRKKRQMKRGKRHLDQ